MTNPIDVDAPRAGLQVHDCVVVVLSDDALLDGPDELRRRLGDVLEPGPARVVLDLSRVSRLSSTTIATLLWAKKTCRSRAVELAVRRPSRGSVGVLLRTGLLPSSTVGDSRHQVQGPSVSDRSRKGVDRWWTGGTRET